MSDDHIRALGRAQLVVGFVAASIFGSACVLELREEVVDHSLSVAKVFGTLFSLAGGAFFINGAHAASLASSISHP